MNKDRHQVTEKILNLTLRIIFLLSGEDYIVVKRQGYHETESRDSCVSEELCRTHSPTLEPSSNSSIHKKNRDQKIVELTNKILHLLTGEVPVRCEDVAIYLSMEEWEYVEEHGELYKDKVLGNRQSLSSLDKPSNRDTPEQCHVPPEEDGKTTQEYQIQNFRIRNPTRNMSEISPAHIAPGNVVFPKQCKKEEEIPTEMNTDKSSRRNTPESCHLPADSVDGAEEDNQMKQNYTTEPRDGIIPQPRKKAELPTDFSTAPECVLNITRVTETDETNLGSDSSCRETLTSSVTLPDMGIRLDDELRFEDSEMEHTGMDYSSVLINNYIKRKTNTQRIQENLSAKKYKHRECEENFTKELDCMSTPRIHEAPQKIHRGKKPHQCFQCGKSFARNSRLHVHQRTHTGEKPFHCTECGKCFTCSHSLVRHQKIHTGEKPFNCLECGKCFSFRPDLVRHQKIHTGEKPFQCSECGKSFIGASRLLAHKRIHTGEKPFHCIDCGKRFSCRQGLVRHQKIHTGEKPFQCSECGKSFTLNYYLLQHKKIHKRKKPFVCTECGKSFQISSNLLLHQRIHINHPLSCSDCGKCFVDKPALLRHQRIHTEETSFECCECGKRFPYRSDLVAHQKTHTGDKPYVCFVCEKSFTHTSNLSAHVRTHTGEKPFVCSECGKSFSHASNLSAHLRIHTGEKPFACSECGKSFTQNSYLLAHKKIHTGVKPFVCSECGKSFRVNSSLLAHQRIHKKKPLSCPDCGKCFADKPALHRHQRIHSAETSFECFECGKRFPYRSVLVTHQKTHTGDKPCVSV